MSLAILFLLVSIFAHLANSLASCPAAARFSLSAIFSFVNFSFNYLRYETFRVTLQKWSYLRGIFSEIFAYPLDPLVKEYRLLWI